MLVRLVANAAALAVATVLLPGITLDGAGPAHQAVTLLVVAAVFGVLNALVKPLVKLVSLPLIVLTLGLFLLVINAVLLVLTSLVANRLGQPWHVATWGSALLGSVIISLVSAAVAGLLRSEDR